MAQNRRKPIEPNFPPKILDPSALPPKPILEKLSLENSLTCKEVIVNTNLFLLLVDVCHPQRFRTSKFFYRDPNVANHGSPTIRRSFFEQNPASMTLRYSVEVVTNKTMQKETTQSVKFSIGTWENGGAILET